VCGLEADKGQQGGCVCGVEEEVLGDDDVDDVVHLNSTVHVARHNAFHTHILITLLDTSAKIVLKKVFI
jgi:hypothetical protein